MQKVFVLEETEERKTLEGRRFGVTNCLAKSSNYNSLHEMIIPEKHIPKIQSNLNKFVLLKGYSQKEDGSIRLAESSTVLNTSDSPVSAEVIQMFKKPEPVQIAAIKTKDKGQRVSLKAQVEHISNLLTTNASKRRIVRLSDETGEIELKLWGDKANLIHAANETVIITCVGVDVYMSKVSLNTTMSTTIQVSDQQTSIKGVVEAANFDDDELSVLINDQLFTIPQTLMDRIFPLGDFSSDVTVTAAVRGKSIISIIHIQGEDLD